MNKLISLDTIKGETLLKKELKTTIEISLTCIMCNKNLHFVGNTKKTIMQLIKDSNWFFLISDTSEKSGYYCGCGIH